MTDEIDNFEESVGPLPDAFRTAEDIQDEIDELLDRLAELENEEDFDEEAIEELQAEIEELEFELEALEERVPRDDFETRRERLIEGDPAILEDGQIDSWPLLQEDFS